MSKLGPSGNNGKRSANKSNRRRRMSDPKRPPSEVKITRADGTVEVRPAYSEKGLRRVVEQGQRKPRTWNEANSRKGGGADFAAPT